MDNLGYLCAAYTIIFVAIFFYVLFLWRRQAALEAELIALEEKLKEVREEIAAHSVRPSRSASS